MFEWKTRVPRLLNDTLSISTIIQSSLIKERALAICGTMGEFSVSSAVAFVVCASQPNKAIFSFVLYHWNAIPLWIPLTEFVLLLRKNSNEKGGNPAWRQENETKSFFHLTILLSL